MHRVDSLINQRMFSKQTPVIYDLTNHLINAGGKRLRPLLTLASANMCGYKGHYHIHLAAVVEFIHTATLLHDDVVDQADLRRQQAAARTIWGNEASVLTGDYLLSMAFHQLTGLGNLELLKLMDILYTCLG